MDNRIRDLAKQHGDTLHKAGVTTNEKSWETPTVSNVANGSSDDSGVQQHGKTPGDQPDSSDIQPMNTPPVEQTNEPGKGL